MKPASLNRLFGAIATSQGVQIGSKEWLAAGPPAFSGQTGGHNSYGWRHDFKVTDGYCRAAISNYASRPSFYEDAPERHLGYYKGGRPIGWVPEEYDDTPRGDRAYLVPPGKAVLVSGPDMQHFWLDPLWAVMDAADETLLVKHPDGSSWPAAWMASVVARLLVKSLAGMVRAYMPYIAGGRATARVIDTFVQAGKRNLVDEEDAQLFLDWLDRYGLPQMERAPGVQEVKGSGRCNWYQQCGWMLLPLWELEAGLDAIGNANLGDRVVEIRHRIGQWALDIDALVPGSASKWEQLTITADMRKGLDGKPLPSLAGVIAQSDLRAPYSYSLWSVAAMDVVRADHPGEAAEKLYGDTVDATKGGDKVWRVDRNREWI